MVVVEGVRKCRKIYSMFKGFYYPSECLFFGLTQIQFSILSGGVCQEINFIFPTERPLSSLGSLLSLLK